ncbi:MAG TPA: transketolase [Oculatellaceae cyanobacterium]
MQTNNGSVELKYKPIVPNYKYPLSTEQLTQLALDMRRQVIRMSHSARAPHLGSALSCIEIVACLYGAVLRIDPLAPFSLERDRFIFSKGHAASALYSALAFMGFIDLSLLESYGTSGSRLPEQPSPSCVPGVEAATGSLGHGLPIGLGMALAAKIKNLSYRTYVLMSDGECNEGSVWEAALVAPSQDLNNMVVIIDFNKWQATGRSEKITALNPLAAKWKAFGWSTFEVNGHNVHELQDVLIEASKTNTGPTAVIAHTVKGKGVSFMEDDNNWHYRVPSEQELSAALAELSL